MSTKHDLETMKKNWESLGIARQFSGVHHFSSSKFKTKAPGLVGFYNWCRQREILDENLQTLKRAIEVAKLVERGESFDEALKVAWRSNPLIKR